MAVTPVLATALAAAAAAQRQMLRLEQRLVNGTRCAERWRVRTTPPRQTALHPAAVAVAAMTMWSSWVDQIRRGRPWSTACS